MKRNTIKYRIFKYNILIIVLLITLTTIAFNVVVRTYFEKDIVKQLDKIAARTEDTALKRGKDVFPKVDDSHIPPPPPNGQNSSSPGVNIDGSQNKSIPSQDSSAQSNPPTGKDSVNQAASSRSAESTGDNINNVQNTNTEKSSDLYGYYFMLNRSIREPLSVLSANYILLDQSKNKVSPPIEKDYMEESDELQDKIINEISKTKDLSSEKYLHFRLSGTEYVSIIKPVYEKNNFGLGWVIIYSSLEKVNQLQLSINLILLAILVISALITMMVSSHASKKISAPFSSLNKHIRYISDRNFGNKIHMPVDDELRELVNNINVMSEKLESYDKAQKTFLQNASHEFRTPLMSIQSYAEGIKYEVVESNTAADIIIDESKRLTSMVEELLYLSRLDSMEESYNINTLNFNDFVNSCVERMNGIAINANKNIEVDMPDNKIKFQADEEKLSRAITNIISNCIRYASSTVKISSELADINIKLKISDDGPGLDENELPYVFERFFKGKKGVYGLGLAISKNVVEKHNGKITAGNSPDSGALFTIELPLNK